MIVVESKLISLTSCVDCVLWRHGVSLYRVMDDHPITHIVTTEITPQIENFAKSHSVSIVLFDYGLNTVIVDGQNTDLWIRGRVDTSIYKLQPHNQAPYTASVSAILPPDELVCDIASLIMPKFSCKCVGLETPSLINIPHMSGKGQVKLRNGSRIMLAYTIEEVMRCVACGAQVIVPIDRVDLNPLDYEYLPHEDDQWKEGVVACESKELLNIFPEILEQPYSVSDRLHIDVEPYSYKTLVEKLQQQEAL